jgi:MSHA pilin protein MshC
MRMKHPSADTQRGKHGQRSRRRGFTLIELIMVVVMLGVLAVFAAPKILNTSDLNARGFRDETLALLRYAQKAAIGQRRMVCVMFNTGSTPHSAVLTLENPTLTSTPLVCNANLVGPKGESPATVTAKSGASYGNPPTIIFDGLGQPVSTGRVALASNVLITFTNASSITVEAGTGYIHD